MIGDHARKGSRQYRRNDAAVAKGCFDPGADGGG
jgi:hypothetical protein